MRLGLPRVAALLFFAALTYLIAGLLVVVRLGAPDRRPAGRTPADAGLPFHEVSFESTDGVPLSAWWVPPASGGSSHAAVLVHGWGSDKSDRQLIETARVYAREGYGVLMLDLRGSGGSGGERRTLGHDETRDVRGALAWLGEKGFYPGRIVLHGWSAGGATVVRSAPGAGVAAVVEEAGYADLPVLLREKIPQVSGLLRFFIPGIFLAARLFLGLDPYSVRPAEDAARLREEGVPLFVIHSESDETVPFKHARLFVEANPDAAFWKLEGYGHVGACDHPEYEERLRGFLAGVAARHL